MSVSCDLRPIFRSASYDQRRFQLLAVRVRNIENGSEVIHRASASAGSTTGSSFASRDPAAESEGLHFRISSANNSAPDHAASDAPSFQPGSIVAIEEGGALAIRFDVAVHVRLPCLYLVRASKQKKAIALVQNSHTTTIGDIDKPMVIHCGPMTPQAKPTAIEVQLQAPFLNHSTQLPTAAPSPKVLTNDSNPSSQANNAQLSRQSSEGTLLAESSTKTDAAPQQQLDALDKDWDFVDMDALAEETSTPVVTDSGRLCVASKLEKHFARTSLLRLTQKFYFLRVDMDTHVPSVLCKLTVAFALQKHSSNVVSSLVACPLPGASAAAVARASQILRPASMLCFAFSQGGLRPKSELVYGPLGELSVPSSRASMIAPNEALDATALSPQAATGGAGLVTISELSTGASTSTIPFNNTIHNSQLESDAGHPLSSNPASFDALDENALTGNSVALPLEVPQWRKALVHQLRDRDRFQRDIFEGIVEARQRLVHRLMASQVIASGSERDRDRDLGVRSYKLATKAELVRRGTALLTRLGHAGNGGTSSNSNSNSMNEQAMLKSQQPGSMQTDTTRTPPTGDTTPDQSRGVVSPSGSFSSQEQLSPVASRLDLNGHSSESGVDRYNSNKSSSVSVSLGSSATAPVSRGQARSKSTAQHRLDVKIAVASAIEHFVDENLAIAQELEPVKFVMSPDGVPIAFRSYLPSPENVKLDVVVVIVVGLAVCSFYRSFIPYGCRNVYGLRSYIYDYRGHGLSGGPRGDARTPQSHLEDLRAVVQVAKWNNPTCSVVLVGHGTGSSLALKYAAWSQAERVDGFVFGSPHLPEFERTELRGTFFSPNSFTKVLQLAFARGTKGRLGHRPAIHLHDFFRGSVFQTFGSTQTKDFMADWNPGVPGGAPPPKFLTANSVVGSMSFESRSLFSAIDVPYAVFLGEHEELLEIDRCVSMLISIPSTLRTVEIVRGQTHFSIASVLDSLACPWIAKTFAHKVPQPPARDADSQGDVQNLELSPGTMLQRHEHLAPAGQSDV
ncbi:hypothetical protein CAOG_01072 [Capsaspora owczarzaki ATCC 30864]|uniref:Serine aminopeptidase S33 domain-containing protein n=1 Tax=Capsaspora owczarzaki (strain ATCC 30864) TaxID=595528 RepID=A0A0D2U394_CAPO3|nr:hypothetical protein CAOG_01072 [Capsaspora owczarzaki ATCC 30864]KJE89636.1 hypothetical protein CAOG_001072 [Capsaspora owczarzaki ATCC 30864]|eukprot:XP_004365943.1 hypothetical protein CAOG_01072 [Capsaspora owczarzaki ATCC 30864]